MNIAHPSHLLNPESIQRIRASAADAETEGKLSVDQLAIVYQQQWFKLLMPKTYSGPEMPLPELVRLEESIAWANGSLGWVVTLCAGAGWFGGFFEPETARLLGTRSACLAGSGAAMGEAMMTDDGYVVSGNWPFASGAHHATHFTANCKIKSGADYVLEEGEALVCAFIFERKDVTIMSSWKCMGMKATGTDAFAVKELFVSKEKCFRIDPRFAVIKTPLYRYPFLQLAETTLAANLSGMAIHFLDICNDIFAEKQKQNNLEATHKSILSRQLVEQENGLDTARGSFYTLLDKSWAELLNGNPDELTYSKVSAASKTLAAIAREAVDKLYPYCGLVAAAQSSEINRIWRDLHTASQHSLLTFCE